MIENWDVAPWAAVVIGGPVLLGAVLAVVLLRRRAHTARPPDEGRARRSPDYSDPAQNR